MEPGETVKTGAEEFETHLTVRPGGAADLPSLLAWAQAHGLKCTHIVLERGASASQPMLTKRGQGSLAEERAAATEIARALAEAGFPVTRIKIEVPPWATAVPLSAAEAQMQPPGRYFEHHLKLLLAPEAITAALTEIILPHGAHLSRNAMKQREDGYQERFVTQRCTGVGRAEAHAALEALLRGLAPLGYPILDIEEEFVVYDSNLALDAGWIQSEKEISSR